MQDEINEKTVNLAVNVGKAGQAELRKALEKLYLELKQRKNKNFDVKGETGVKHGKQTLEQLSKNNDGLTTVELTDPNLRLLQNILKKYNVDFAAVKDGKGKYTLFFKGKDADAITHAIKKYTQILVGQKRNQSIKKTLHEAKKAAKTANIGKDKVKNRSKGARDR